MAAQYWKSFPYQVGNDKRANTCTGDCRRAVSTNEAFQFAYQNLRENKEFVLEAPGRKTFWEDIVPTSLHSVIHSMLMISIYFNKTSEDHWCLKPGQVLKTSGFTLQFASEALRCNREAGIILISLFCVSVHDEDNT